MSAVVTLPSGKELDCNARCARNGACHDDKEKYCKYVDNEFRYVANSKCPFIKFIGELTLPGWVGFICWFSLMVLALVATRKLPTHSKVEAFMVAVIPGGLLSFVVYLIAIGIWKLITAHIQ